MSATSISTRSVRSPGGPPSGPPPPPGRPAGLPRPVPRRWRRWRQRWYRLVVPFALLGLLVGVTMLARSAEEPDLRDPQTLSPTGTGPDGSSRLARMLADNGVRIDYVATIDEAIQTAETDGEAVIFIPKPTLFGALFAAVVPSLPVRHRVVMVAPAGRHLLLAGANVSPGAPRWAAMDSEPGCAVPEARAAGRATALRSRYTVDEPLDVCYRGGLVRSDLGAGSTELFVVGASDPFRNRRIDEHNNAELALELLTGEDRVIWVGALPFDPDFQWPGLPDLPELDPPSRGEGRSDRSGLSGLFYGYPAQILAGLALAGLVAVLIALARARRFGAPVSEPLPVLVPATEVVAGRGRLYQRAQGREVALAALRTAALRRVVPALGLPNAPPPEPDVIVAAAAGRARLTEEYVRYILYGPAPSTDEELTQAVAALDALVEALTHEGGAS